MLELQLGRRRRAHEVQQMPSEDVVPRSIGRVEQKLSIHPAQYESIIENQCTSPLSDGWAGLRISCVNKPNLDV